MELREDDLHSKDKSTKKTCRLITTYNQLHPDINTITKKHWPITQTQKKCRDALTNFPQVAYRRNKNLADILVGAKFREVTPEVRQNKQQQNTFRWNRCSWCKKLVESDTFTSNTTKKSYKIYHKMTSTSQWVIYLTECRKCKKQ